MVAAGCGFEDLGITTCPSRLLPGELVVTEIMANPGGASGEWIEIFNATREPVDLRGLVLAVDGGDGSDAQQHAIRAARIDPGAYLVLGRDSAQRAAAPIDYVYGNELGALPDQGGRVTLRCDVITVDVAVYPAPAPGVAVGMSGAVLPDASSNDEPASWCAARTSFAPGRTGSPGAVNEACAGTPGSPGDGTCEQDGNARAVVTPAPGDVVITEVMANPAAVSDDTGEWIELYVGRDVDLDGLSVGTAPDGLRVVIPDGACLRATAGSHVVLAASADAASNGGLGEIAAELGINLRNSDGTVLIGHGDAVLDQVTWASAPAGRSLALDPAHRSPAGNDVAAHWCTSTAAPYGSGDIGTPGGVNDACVLPGKPPGDAGAPGEPPGDAGTPSDGGASGDAAPGVPMCSDGQTGAMRPIVSPIPGTVRITEIMANPQAVPDSDGEWIEVRFDGPADLNGLEVGKVPGQVLLTIEAPGCLAVAGGSRVVLARTSDGGRNGGLPRVDAVFGFDLVNNGGSLFVGVRGEVLDEVEHGRAEVGASASLDESDMTWCTSPMGTVYGDGDRGTPGAANATCDEPAAARAGPRAALVR